MTIRTYVHKRGRGSIGHGTPYTLTPLTTQNNKKTLTFGTHKYFTPIKKIHMEHINIGGEYH